MYSFTGSGTKENVIQTGHIVITFNDVNNISIQNRYPETDSEGLASTDTNSQMTFTVTSDITGDTKVNYALGITDIQEGATLTQDYIKIYLKKGNSVVAGFTENKGELISSFKPLYIENVMTSHVLLTDVISGSEVHTYTLKAWIDENYKLPSTESNTNGTHTNNTTSETFKFKIKGYGTTEDIEVKEPPTLNTMMLGKNNSNVIGVLPEASLQTTHDDAGDKSGLYVSTDTNDGRPTYYFRGNNGCQSVKMTQDICTLLGGTSFTASNSSCKSGTTYYYTNQLTEEQCIANGGTYDENAVNNTLTFAGFTWKIVRINEDGSIRILLNEGINNNTTYYFTDSNYQAYYSDVTGGVKTKINSWFEEYLKNYEDYIVDTQFCESYKVTSQVSANTYKSAMAPSYTEYIPNFKCSADGNGKGIITSKIGLLSVDDVLLAGGYTGKYTNLYFENINTFTASIESYNTTGNVVSLWTYNQTLTSYLINTTVSYYEKMKTPSPVSAVISLKSDINVNGSGTETDPYIVQTN